MALWIEKAFGVKMDTLMRMQLAYEIAQKWKREGEIRVRRVMAAARFQVPDAGLGITAILDFWRAWRNL